MKEPEENGHRAVLAQTLQHAAAYLDDLATMHVGPAITGPDLCARVRRPTPESGTPPRQIVDELVADVSPGLMGNASGRFFAWVIGGCVPSALAADWLTSTWDQNAGMHAVSPAAAAIEEICGEWLKDLLGLPSGASFALVTGCQMAHVTCLAAARNAVLARAGWEVEGLGLRNAPPIHVFTGCERHGSVDRALRLLGMGTDSLAPLPVDARGRLEPATLAQALEQKPADDPAIAILQAGDLNIGAFDPFAELIPICREHEAWVHIDGAFGLWAAVSPHFDHLLAGANKANSWSTDGHKWLNVPYDCGYAFVADPTPHFDAMTHRAAYLSHDMGSRDQIDWNPEYSRRARGFPTYAAIRELGRAGIREVVERCCRFAKDLAVRIGALKGVELLWEPTLNQGLVRFLHPGQGVSAEEQDRYNDQVVADIVETGEVFFGPTTWRGQRCMRISLCNWRTTAEDIDRAVEAVRSVLAS